MLSPGAGPTHPRAGRYAARHGYVPRMMSDADLVRFYGSISRQEGCLPDLELRRIEDIFRTSPDPLARDSAGKLLAKLTAEV